MTMIPCEGLTNNKGGLRCCTISAKWAKTTFAVFRPSFERCSRSEHNLGQQRQPNSPGAPPKPANHHACVRFAPQPRRLFNRGPLTRPYFLQEEHRRFVIKRFSCR